jgi:single-stranded-DNA-specific exonuclease
VDEVVAVVGSRPAPLAAGSPCIDPGPAGEEALVLARESGLSITVADVLARRSAPRGAVLERWLEPKLAHLTQPQAMADLDAACARLADAIARREPIAVFGDYDCDGITATTVMTEALRALGGEVTPLLASRFAGGYGLSGPALERVRASGARVLVTCDCGSSDHERLWTARQAGIDAIVIDHHLVPDETLPAFAFLNPHRPECGHPYKGLASCGLALVVAAALRRRLGVELDVRRWLDLVAVGTVADVAPLDGDNRVMVRAGLRVVDHGGRPGLKALAVLGAGGRRVPVTATDVAYQIAPRLNAPGRLGDPAAALELLCETDRERAWALAERLEALTVERRALQRRITGEALADIAACGFDADPALVLAQQGWHPGVVGIVAGRLADLTGKPTVVVALEGTRGRGSVRGPQGFRLYDALVACKETLLGFGGHQAAAGIEVAAAGVERFRDAWRTACAAQLLGAPPRARQLCDARLDDRDDLGQVLADLERLEPCGERNPAPRLWLGRAPVTAARVVGEHHLRLDVELRGRTITAFAPEMARVIEGVSTLAGRQVTLVGKMRRDHYRGGDAPEILVDGVSEA